MDHEIVLCRFEPRLNKVIFSLNGVLMATDLHDLEECGKDNFFLTEKKVSPRNGLSAPVTVQIQTTNRCNFKCKHCYVSSGKDFSPEITHEQLLFLLDNLKKWGVLKIQWVGGEVFVRKGFWKLAEYAKLLGFEQSLLTNGTFFGTTLKPAIIQKAWSLFYTIQVSVDDYGDQFNSFVGKRAWSVVIKAIENLALCKSEERRLTVATILCLENIKSLPKLSSVFDCKIDAWRLGKEIVTGRSCRTQKETIDALFKAWYVVKILRSKVKRLLITHPFDRGVSGDSELLLPHDWRTDNGARTFMYIGSNGEAYPFPLLANMKRFCGGSIFTETLDDIWFSKEFDSYRDITRLETGCYDCKEPCQVWPRYHFVQGDNLNLETTPFSYPGCPRFKENKTRL